MNWWYCFHLSMSDIKPSIIESFLIKLSLLLLIQSVPSWACCTWKILPPNLTLPPVQLANWSELAYAISCCERLVLVTLTVNKLHGTICKLKISLPNAIEWNNDHDDDDNIIMTWRPKSRYQRRLVLSLPQRAVEFAYESCVFAATCMFRCVCMFVCMRVCVCR